MTDDDQELRRNVAAAESWVFDVDSTLFDGLSATALRPGARLLLARLDTLGKVIVLWSSGGAEYARRRAAATGIAHHVDRFASKGPMHDGRHGVPQWIGDLDRAVFVDDRTQELPAGVRAIQVRPYLAHNPHDRELQTVIRLLDAWRSDDAPS